MYQEAAAIYQQLGYRREHRRTLMQCAMLCDECDLVSQERQWEAALAASFYNLDNLIAILDRNGLQATGCCAERFNTAPVVQKWESFGWHVFECNGHDMKEIIEVFNRADAVKGKPVMVVADTVKGKGISFAENNVAFHNGAMTMEQYDQALKELANEGGIES
jgi:transketolase